MGFGSRHGCRAPASNFGETWRRMVSSEQAHDRVLLRLRYFCGRGRKVRFRGGIRTIRAIARRGCRKSRSPSGVLRKQLERVALLYWLLGRSGRSFAKRGTLSSTFNGVNVLLLKVEHLVGRLEHRIVLFCFGRSQINCSPQIRRTSFGELGIASRRCTTLFDSRI